MCAPISLLLLLAIAACAGYETGSEKGMGLGLFDTKSFWYSGYADEEIGAAGGTSATFSQGTAGAGGDAAGDN